MKWILDRRFWIFTLLLVIGAIVSLKYGMRGLLPQEEGKARTVHEAGRAATPTVAPSDAPRLPTRGLVPDALVGSHTPKRGPVQHTDVPSVDLDHGAAASDPSAACSLQVQAIEAETGRPVEGASVTLQALAVGGETQPEDRRSSTDSLGFVAFDDLPPGEYSVSIRSEWHEVALMNQTMIRRAHSPAPVALERLGSVRFQLLGTETTAWEEYQVSKLGDDFKVTFGHGGRAELPWKPGDETAFTVHGPESLEIVSLFGIPDPRGRELHVRVDGGLRLAAASEGTHESDERLVMTLSYVSALGHEIFVNHIVQLGQEVVFPFCEPGLVWVDVGVQRPDRTIEALGRARAELRAGEDSSVVVHLGSKRTYAAFLGPSGVRISKGEIWLSTRGDIESSPIGGSLDAEGRILVAAQDDREFFAIGVAGEGGVFVADVPCVIDTRAGGEWAIPLGDVQSSAVELRDANSDAPLASWRFEVVGLETGFYCDVLTTGSDGAPAQVQWYDRGKPALLIRWDGLWSPAEPVPITPGLITVPITQRTTCTFSSPGGNVEAVRHVMTGLDDAGLLAYGGVEVSTDSAGRRYSGIPAGMYVVRLAGDEVWRGPFAVPNRGPAEVVVPSN